MEVSGYYIVVVIVFVVVNDVTDSVNRDFIRITAVYIFVEDCRTNSTFSCHISAVCWVTVIVILICVNVHVSGYTADDGQQYIH